MRSVVRSIRRVLFLALAAFVPIASAIGAASINTYVGTGESGFSGDRGYAAEAKLHQPIGIARGPDNALYICDTDNHRIRKVSRVGRILTVAGTGEAGWSGDGGPALAAKLHAPTEVRFDFQKENVYWVERSSHTVRMLDVKTGNIKTVAGNGKSGFAGDGGPAEKAQLDEPQGLAFDGDDNLYVADVNNHRIRRIDAKTGVITTFVGNGKTAATAEGAPFDQTSLHGPRALAFDRDGNLWVALRDGHAVYKLDVKNKTVHRSAGTGEKGFSGDGGPATAAKLNGPQGISVSGNGYVFIADTGNHCIRMLNPTTGTIERAAGTGELGDGPDGKPELCKLLSPHAVFVDRDGALFIGDTGNHRIRVIRVEE